MKPSVDTEGRPCEGGKDCVGERCPHFVDLGLEGTDCLLELPKGPMDVVVSSDVGMNTVFL